MADTRLTIRDATPDDAPAIAAVHVRSWQVAYRGQMPDEILDGLRVEARERWWRTQWWQQAGASHRLVVAQVEESMVGFAAAGPARDDDAAETATYPEQVGELYAIYVDPDAWGTGAGRRLMERTVEEMRSSGFREATLWVLDANELARRFYELAGWTPDGTHKTEQLGPSEVIEVRYRRNL